MREFFFRRKAEFVRGHATWLIWPMWAITTVTMWWFGLVPELKKIALLENTIGIIWTNILFFGLSIMSVYLTAAILVGRWDYRKGAYAAESTIQMLNNPKMVELMNNVEKLLELTLNKKEKDKTNT